MPIVPYEIISSSADKLGFIVRAEVRITLNRRTYWLRIRNAQQMEKIERELWEGPATDFKGAISILNAGVGKVLGFDQEKDTYADKQLRLCRRILLPYITEEKGEEVK
mgnify:CR=1 FL=1